MPHRACAPTVEERPFRAAVSRKKNPGFSSGPYPITVVCSGFTLYITRTSPGWP